jgi:hypothetical protein
MNRLNDGHPFIFTRGIGAGRDLRERIVEMRNVGFFPAQQFSYFTVYFPGPSPIPGYLNPSGQA